jgi:two-component system response regulator HydG
MNQRFTKSLRGISPAALQLMLSYDWPGNVRELLNCMERALAMSDGEVLRDTDLPERVRAVEPVRTGFAVDDAGGLVPLEEIERRYILHAMRTLDGNKRVAAQVLGLDRSTLYRKLEIYGEHGRKRDDPK